MDGDARASASRRGPGRKGGKGQTPPGGQPPGPEVPVPAPEPVPAWKTRRRAERNMAKPRKEPVKNEEFFFPPDQVVYATVQWVLKDYQNKDNPRLFSPIVDDINTMGCTIPCYHQRREGKGCLFGIFVPNCRCLWRPGFDKG